MPIEVVHSFFHWTLRLRSDTLRAASSLRTYWNTFGLVRRNETGCTVIDAEIKRQWQGVSRVRRHRRFVMLTRTQVHQSLVEEFRLETEKKPKPIVRAEDQFELLRTLWGSAEVGMEHERLRVQLALILQLAGITGNRPEALLSLRYKHVKIALLRDPEGSEWPRPIVELTFEKTKSYMGAKDAYVEVECERSTRYVLTGVAEIRSASPKFPVSPASSSALT
jgi:integrase